MKAWIIALSTSTLSLLILCIYLAVAVVDQAMATDDSRQYGKGLEIEIGRIMTILERTSIGMPQEKLDGIAREMERAELTVTREGNDVTISTMVFRIEGGTVQSVRRLQLVGDLPK